jgi:hypothetical protein
LALEKFSESRIAIASELRDLSVRSIFEFFNSVCQKR